MIIIATYWAFGASQVARVVKIPPANAGDIRGALALGQEDPLEEGRATHSSILTWRILRTEEHRVTKNWTWLK